MKERKVEIECIECDDFELEVKKTVDSDFPELLRIFGEVLDTEVDWYTCPVCGGENKIIMDGQEIDHFEFGEEMI